jgi:LacI family transcriptional regulator, galactose operon repressor
MAQSRARTRHTDDGHSGPSAPRIQDVARRAGVAIGTVSNVLNLGIAVPDELLVVGYDDDHFASESSIPVSTVSQPGRRMGEPAVELLLEEIREPTDHTHRTKMLDPHLVPRRSSLR